MLFCLRGKLPIFSENEVLYPNVITNVRSDSEESRGWLQFFIGKAIWRFSREFLETWLLCTVAANKLIIIHMGGGDVSS